MGTLKIKEAETNLGPALGHKGVAHAIDRQIWDQIRRQPPKNVDETLGPRIIRDPASRTVASKDSRTDS